MAIQQTCSRAPAEFAARNAHGAPLNSSVFAGFEPNVRLWMLRMLCILGAAWNRDFDAASFVDETRMLLPLHEAIVNDKSALVAHYRSLLIRRESRHDELRGRLACNLAVLSQSLRLGETERGLLAFFLIYDELPAFEHTVDAVVGRIYIARAIWQVSAIVSVSPTKMEQVRHRSALLVDSSFETKDSLHVAVRPVRSSTFVFVNCLKQHANAC